MATTVGTEPTLPIKCRPVVKPAPADDGITVVFVSVVIVCVLNLKASDPRPKYLAAPRVRISFQFSFAFGLQVRPPILRKSSIFPTVD